MSESKNTQATSETEDSWALFIKNLARTNNPKVEEMVNQLEKNPVIKLNVGTFTLQEITVAQQLDMEERRAKWAAKYETKTPGSRQAASVDLVEIYVKLAEYYLGMDREAFLKTPWPTMKVVLDACELRTQFGTPLSMKT